MIYSHPPLFFRLGTGSIRAQTVVEFLIFSTLFIIVYFLFIMLLLRETCCTSIFEMEPYNSKFCVLCFHLVFGNKLAYCSVIGACFKGLCSLECMLSPVIMYLLNNKSHCREASA